MFSYHQTPKLMLMDEQTESWTCSLCTFVNAPGQDKCNVCDSKAPLRSRSSSNRTTPEKYAHQPQRSSVAFGLSTPTKYKDYLMGSKTSSPEKYSPLPNKLDCFATPPKHSGRLERYPPKQLKLNSRTPSPSKYSTPPKHHGRIDKSPPIKPTWTESPISCSYMSISDDENSPPPRQTNSSSKPQRKQKKKSSSSSQSKMQLSTSSSERKSRSRNVTPSGRDYVTGFPCSKHRCPHCDFSWPLAIEAPECPKCWKSLHVFTPSTSVRYNVISNSSPSSALMHVEGKCKKGASHHYKFGKCMKCGQDEGKLAARGAFASPKDVLLHDTCIVNEGGKHFFKFAACTLCGKSQY